MKLKVAVVISLVFVLAVFTTWALAQSGSADVYSACVNNSSGTIHVLSEGETCANNEMLIQWNKAGAIGAATVFFDETLVKHSRAIRAFIPTNSTSNKCLVTLHETPYEWDAITTFCAHRHFFNQDGILVSVFYPPWVNLEDGAHTGADFIISATVWHEGATMYGPPVLSPE
jgi:hypothetical protein